MLTTQQRLETKLAFTTILASVYLGAVACGGDSSDGSNAIDNRAPMPEPDSQAIDLVTPEVEIPAATERMYCLYLEHEGEDVAVNELEMFQGGGGHHIALVHGETDRPVGTLEDCTTADSIQTMIPVAIPLPLPEGHAVRLRKGQRFVLQFHYINVHSRPILVRDVGRLHTIPMEEVEHWVSTFTTNSSYFEIPAGKEGEVEWDCLLDEDLELLLIGGHMHEWGTSFDFEAVDQDSSVETIYSVPDWVSSYRDVPPIQFLFHEPRTLPAGTVLRTRCRWDNPTDEPMGFPEEMCASFGYIRSADNYFCSPEG